MSLRECALPSMRAGRDPRVCSQEGAAGGGRGGWTLGESPWALGVRERGQGNCVSWRGTWSFGMGIQ